MVLFARRVGERYADLLDWVDYRPDADFRPLLALPLVAAAGYLLGGAIGFEIALAGAIVLTAALATVALVGMTAWVLANALLDVMPTLTLPSLEVRVQAVAKRTVRL